MEFNGIHTLGHKVTLQPRTQQRFVRGQRPSPQGESTNFPKHEGEAGALLSDLPRILLTTLSRIAAPPRFQLGSNLLHELPGGQTKAIFFWLTIPSTTGKMNSPIAFTTSSKGASASSPRFRRNARHCVCLAGLLKNSAVKARGGDEGRAVPRLRNVASRAAARTELWNARNSFSLERALPQPDFASANCWL